MNLLKQKLLSRLGDPKHS